VKVLFVYSVVKPGLNKKTGVYPLDVDKNSKRHN